MLRKANGTNNNSRARLCRFEKMEPRCLLSADPLPIRIGAVYLEDGSGFDEEPDTIEVTFDGGAPGTQLTQLVIETDKAKNDVADLYKGLTIGDAFFDTEPNLNPGDRGAFDAVGLVIEEQIGFDIIDAQVLDGGTTLVMTFEGFDAGEYLKFSVDVDEVGGDGDNAVAEGNEFGGSWLTGTFAAAHYAEATGEAKFRDYYDGNRLDPKLPLPDDNYMPPGDYERPIHTAGAFFEMEQEALPSSIAGTVFEDFDRDIIQDTGDEGIPDVTIELRDNDTGLIIATTITDEFGNYLFEDLQPGNYTVLEGPVLNYDDVGARPGKVDGATRGSAVGMNTIDQIELYGDEDSVGNDFAEIKPAALSGHVYEDLNNDGIFDTSTESGIYNALVVVQYIPDAGPPPLPIEVRTEADGSWSVDNLTPGNYVVTEVTPVGYHDGLDRAGTAGGTAHNPNNDLINGITLISGQSGEDYDFGEIVPATLSGYVYIDANNDGVFDLGTETGIGGATVYVQPLPDAGPAPPPYMVTTNPDGSWSVGNLWPGNYQVTEDTPLGYLDGLDAAGTAGGTAHNPDNDLITGITLVQGQSGKRYDFGEIVPATLSGYVYRDDNDNGIFEKKAELPIEGANLTLLDEFGNPTGDFATSDADGFYQFVDLKPGIYSVSEEQPDGYKDGQDTPGNVGGIADDVPADLIHGIPLKQGTAAEEYNFGELLPASISGRVHADIGIRNCEVDINEPLLQGVTIYLLDASGNRIAKTVTDEKGEYYFGDLDPGVYGVEEIQPAGYLDGYDHPGTEGGIVSENDHITQVPLGPGVAAEEYNFCELVPSSISGYVFQDGSPIFTPLGTARQDPADVRDGKFTPDDKPIAGVVMRLGDGSGAPVLDANGKPITTKTNSQGFYKFTMLEPGLYTVLQDHPDGYEDSLDTAGSNGGFAVNPSDGLSPSILSILTVDPENDAIVRISLGAGENAVQNNFSEVTYTSPPFFPPNPPDTPTPPSKPPIMGEAPPRMGHLRPNVPVVQETLGGGAGGVGYTWHLSIINGGQPRRMRPGIEVSAYAEDSPFDPGSWTGRDMSYSKWIIADDNGQVVKEVAFGMVDSLPVTGDFNGDGITDVAVFIDGHWFIDLNGNGIWDEGDLWAQLGRRHDQPVTGDWDADGKTDIGIYGQAWLGDPRAIEYEPGLPDAQNETVGAHKNMPPEPANAPILRRRLKRTADGEVRSDVIDHVFQFGTSDDMGVTGDWNGDGIATVGIFRGGKWFLDVDGNGRWSEKDATVVFGTHGDIPVVGDFNGDGIDDLGVFNDGRWTIDSDGNRRMDATDKVFELGRPGDIPITGDFDGDGIDQAGIYRDAS